MKCLPAELRGRQTRHSWERTLPKLRQVALRTRRTGPLHRHGQHHLSQPHLSGWTDVVADLVDDAHDVQLLSRPQQRSDIADSFGADLLGFCQVDHQ